MSSATAAAAIHQWLLRPTQTKEEFTAFAATLEAYLTSATGLLVDHSVDSDVFYPVIKPLRFTPDMSPSFIKGKLEACVHEVTLRDLGDVRTWRNDDRLVFTSLSYHATPCLLDDYNAAGRRWGLSLWMEFAVSPGV